MSIPYRTQQTLKRLAGTLLVLLVVGAVILGLWFLWLQRYVVYTRSEGAVLDFNLSETLPAGQEAQPPESDLDIEIYYNEGEGKVDLSTELTQLKGYYVLGSALASDPAGVWEQIQALPAGTPVMLDVRTIYGTFYYSTSTGRPLNSNADIRGVDALINKLKDSGYYTIARVPALRDREYGLNNTNEGLPVSGGYLWMDEDGCYWLNPARKAIVNYLTDIATELRALGFDEVVFEDFYFPETDRIIFDGNKQETLEKTAQTIVTACATETFAVSFVSDGTWKEPEGRSRVYREDISDAIALMELSNNLTMENPKTRLVLITNNLDTRFEDYGILRPIELAH